MKHKLLPILFSVLIPILAHAQGFFDAPEWISEQSLSENQYTAMTYEASDVWYDSNYWTAGGWCKIGKGWFHPEAGTRPVLRFTAPKDGQVVIAGRMFKKHVAPNTDGVAGDISINGTKIWEGAISGGDETGLNHRLVVDLKAGDALRFSVNCAGKIECDTTGWNPEIAYIGSEEKYSAEDGFHDANTTGSLWSYESYQPTDAQVNALTQGELDTLKSCLKSAVDSGYEQPTDVRLWLMQLQEWKRDDGFKKVEVHLAAMRKLLEKLYPDSAAPEAKPWYDRLAGFEAAGDKATLEFYMNVRIWKRALVLSNPLLKGVPELLFVKRRPTSYNHEVMQYFGWRAQKSTVGGIFRLVKPGHSLECVNILGENQKVLQNGNVVDPCLSFDGKKVVFSYVELSDNPRIPWRDAPIPKLCNEKETDHSEYYHLYEVNVDGTGFRQLTDSFYEDLMPAYLPDGGIVFVSSRRKGHPRCFWWGFGERWTNYTTFRMNGDGSNVQPLSWHETNEWYPVVGHDGQIFYSRWDYIDRDAVTHQNLWSMRPDGTNPTAVWGNASLDIFCTFQPKPIPGSRKWMVTASAHHSCTGGSLVILDPSIAKDGPTAIERITPEIPFPEAEGNDIPTFYTSPWPLSEDFYLTAYSPSRLTFEPQATQDAALGLYILDRFGNRELLYRDAVIGSDSPIPLVARETPPVLPSALPEDAPDHGRFFVFNIYEGLGDVAPGSIKSLRVVQIFPKTTLTGNDPPIGLAGEENGRAILGTVPVEADGSVNFIAPAQKPILFQALNERGEAYQIMRSLTYLQPGEEIACIGCHENRTSAVGNGSPYVAIQKGGQNPGQNMPLAARREPSQIDSGRDGGRPYSYVERVQPIWNARCISCHGAKPEDPEFLKHKIDLTDANDGAFNRSYMTLVQKLKIVPVYAQRNRVEITEPGGKNGAIGSRLMEILRDGKHYDVTLTPEEWWDISTWIDQNALYLGTTEAPLREIMRAGKPAPMQEIQ